MLDYTFTTTELRSKASQAIELLKEGKELFLIHRSRIIGKILPVRQESEIKITDSEDFIKALEKIRPKKIVPRSQRRKKVISYLKKRYG